MPQKTDSVASNAPLGSSDALEQARRTLELLPPGDPNRSASLTDIGDALRRRFSQLGDLDALTFAIELFREALNLHPSGHIHRLLFLDRLAEALWAHRQQISNLDMLAEAVELLREALALRPRGHPDHSSSLNNLASALQTRFEQLGDLDSLTEAVDLDRQALNLQPQGHPYRSWSLHGLASGLKTRFEQLGDLDSLTEAIDLYRQALDLHPQGNPNRSSSLNSLADALRTRFKQLGDLDSLAEAIDLHRQALDLNPQGHPNRSFSLNSLANALQTRFEQQGDLDSLAEAVNLHRQALDLRPQGHPNRSSSLNNLAQALKAWFEQLGDLDSLAEAVDLLRQTLDLHPQGNPNRSSSLNNLANALQTRFEQLGDLSSLAEAVSLHRQALDLHPQGHPDRSSSLNNLANALQTRFGQLDDLDALSEAVDLLREALALRPQGHPNRSDSLNNLASALQTRFEQLGDLSSLAEAIDLHREALDLRPQGHSNQALSLNNLANALQSRFKQLGDLDSLAEAINLHRQALDLHPQGHPGRSSSLRNLASALYARSRTTSGASDDSVMSSLIQDHMADLDEALRLYTEGLRLCTGGHPDRINFLFDIGLCMIRPWTHVHNFEDGICYILSALRDPALSAQKAVARFTLSLVLVEAGYQCSIEQMRTAQVGYRRHHDLLLEAYTLVIRLFPRAASFGLDHAARLRALSGAEAISRNAATRAIAAGRDTEAVEMLEEGRGVFWSQALRLRTTELDHLPIQDAQELRRLFQTLETGSVRDESMSKVQREQHIEARRRLSNAAEALITDIRSRPGMSRFLLPSAFSSLVQSLPDSGFVVLLVASDLGHCALVLDCANGNTASLELVPPEGGFFSEAVKVTLPRDEDSECSMEYTNVSRPFGVSGRTKRIPTDPFNRTLAQLWTLIVKPVIEVLGLKVCPCNTILSGSLNGGLEGLWFRPSSCMVVCHRTAHLSSHSCCWNLTERHDRICL
jgi:tetratricopeptide (TPR) repeat protein